MWSTITCRESWEHHGYCLHEIHSSIWEYIGGFLSHRGTPSDHPFLWDVPWNKPSILGYPQFWKPPYSSAFLARWQFGPAEYYWYEVWLLLPLSACNGQSILHVDHVVPVCTGWNNPCYAIIGRKYFWVYRRHAVQGWLYTSVPMFLWALCFVYSMFCKLLVAMLAMLRWHDYICNRLHAVLKSGRFRHSFAIFAMHLADSGSSNLSVLKSSFGSWPPHFRESKFCWSFRTEMYPPRIVMDQDPRDPCKTPWHGQVDLNAESARTARASGQLIQKQWGVEHR